MAFLITEECILCDACVPECPNEAISEGYEIYSIDPSRCTECVGFFSEPRCSSVCPTECCEPDPDYNEDEMTLFERAKYLHPDQVFSEASFPSRFRN